MALNFPDPNDTQEYMSPDGVMYVWDGVKWASSYGIPPKGEAGQPGPPGPPGSGGGSGPPGPPGTGSSVNRENTSSNGTWRNAGFWEGDSGDGDLTKIYVTSQSGFNPSNGMVWTNSNGSGMMVDNSGLGHYYSGGGPKTITKHNYMIFNNKRDTSTQMNRAMIYTGGSTNSDRYSLHMLDTTRAEGMPTYALSDPQGIGTSLDGFFADARSAIKVEAYHPGPDSWIEEDDEGNITRQYDSTRSSTELHVGLDLDVLNAVYPRLVVRNGEDDTPAHLNEDACLSVLLGGLKRAYERIASLEARLGALEQNEIIDDAVDSSLLNTVASLTTRIEALE